jgi:hypothetical protein
MANKKVQYGQQVLPASQPLAQQDRVRVEKVVPTAIEIALKCAADPDSIFAIFGPDKKYCKVSDIQKTYASIAARLKVLAATAGSFRTDYIGADLEMRIGGSSAAGSGEITLTLTTLAGESPEELAVTLIHETSHEIDKSIIDRGYYGSARFTTLTEKQKVSNAAHYEELPRRLLGLSQYNGQSFKPKSMIKKGDQPEDQLSKVVRLASEGLRSLWEFTTSMHDYLRNSAAGGPQSKTAMQSQVVERIKQAYLLPGGETGGKAATVITALDFTLIEGVARTLSRAREKVKELSAQASGKPQMAAKYSKMAPEKVALQAIVLCGGFTGFEQLEGAMLDSIRGLMIEVTKEDAF